MIIDMTINQFIFAIVIGNLLAVIFEDIVFMVAKYLFTLKNNYD